MRWKHKLKSVTSTAIHCELTESVNNICIQVKKRRNSELKWKTWFGECTTKMLALVKLNNTHRTVGFIISLKWFARHNFQQIDGCGRFAADLRPIPLTKNIFSVYEITQECFSDNFFFSWILTWTEIAAFIFSCWWFFLLYWRAVKILSAIRIESKFYFFFLNSFGYKRIENVFVLLT